MREIISSRPPRSTLRSCAPPYIINITTTSTRAAAGESISNIITSSSNSTPYDVVCRIMTSHEKLSNAGVINSPATTATSTTTMPMPQSPAAPMLITTVFFDLDNTLIPTRKADDKACNRMCDLLQRAPHNLDAALAATTCAHFLRTFRACPDNAAVPLDEWRERLWSEALPAGERHRADVVYARWLELRFRYLALTTANVALLQRLRTDGYRLALITNGPSAAQWEKVRRLSVARLFDVVLVSGDLPWEKPDRRIFEVACRQLGVHVAECVMVGDKLDTDIQGGIDANLGGTIWTPLTVDETFAARPIQPTFIVHNLPEMRQHLPPIKASSTTTSSARRVSNGNVTGKGLAADNGNFSALRSQHLHHLRVASLPDLDSGNSNSSDGS